MRENKIEQYLVAQVKFFRGETRKLQWIARHAAPDRFVWLPTWPFPKLAELKAPGKSLEAHQKREHKRLKKMSIKCSKLDSFKDVDKFLSKY